MAITLSAETQKLIKERMKQTGLPTADDVVRLALQTLDPACGEDYEDLPDEVRHAIEEAEARYACGEGVPLDEAFDRLRKKHLGR